MSYSLCEKIKNLKAYNTSCEVYKNKLDANESFFSIDGELYKKVIDKLSEIDFNRYPDPNCSKLCDCFAKFYNIDKDFVTAGNGSDELISVIINSFLACNDKVLTVSPDFSMYSFYAHLAERELIELDKKEDLVLNVDTIIDIAKKTDPKMIIFSNPCNPTSLGVCKDEVIRLIKSVDALVVLDEAYMDFWNESLINQINEFENLIILRTASKAWGMASIRLGFAVANLKLTNALKACKSPYNVNTVTQKIGEVIYSNKELLIKMKDQILIQRDYLYNQLERLSNIYDDITVYPSCTNFVFIKLKSDKESDFIYKYLKEKSIIVRVMDKYLRITASNNDDMNEFLLFFEEALKRSRCLC